MGAVYRAHDTRLGRQVAIKVLPFGLATNSERLHRFEQEARAAAALNHPNILALHDIGQHDGAPYIVTELLEGVTLRERLASGSLPVRKAVEHAVQVAHGLAAAHEKGIVHRDLKPENIFVTDDGHVKILDFGIAKLTQAEAVPAVATGLPTSPANTSAGLVLGTMGYISPEQLRGLPADHRSDIFAFGVVLYEMLAGRRAFPGETSADIISAILKEDPLDLPVSDRHIPPALVRIVDRCLEKTSSARFQTVSDLGFALEALSSPLDAIPATAALAPSGTGAMGDRLARTLFGTALLVLFAAIVVGVVTWNQRRPASAPVARFAVSRPVAPIGSTFLVNPEASSLSSQAVSRDGTRFAIVADGRLHLRNLNEMEVRPVRALESALPITQPVFSPDGTSLLYVEGPTPVPPVKYFLMKVPVTGGNPVQVAGPLLRLPLDVTWETEETILYADTDGIKRVASNGGEPEILVKALDGEVLGCPRIVPRGAWVMFCSTKATEASRWDSAEVLMQSIDSGDRRLILKGGSDARYVSTGHLVYAQGTTLFALPFDVGALRVTGMPVPIVEGVRRPFRGLSGTADFSVSDTGTLVYVPASPPPASLGALALVDMNGVVTKLNVPPAQYRGPQLTIDGRQLVVEIVSPEGQSDVWVYDMSGGSALRQLTHGGKSGHPIWTRDSKRVTFESTRDGRSAIYWQPADGKRIAERLITAEGEERLTPDSWSKDGRTLSFSKENTAWTLSPDKGAKPVMLVGGNERGASAVFSPDGGWIAYRENRRAGTGNASEQIYIERFPATGTFYRISQIGGASPLWSRDGRRLFYRSGIAGMMSEGPRLMVVDIELEPVPRARNERVLPIKSFQAVLNYRDYDITPQGKLLMIVPAGSSESSDAQRPPINVVVHWFEELKRLVPTK